MTERDPGRSTRERLVASATGLFRRRGVARVGIADICERAGVTKGVFSYHFPGGKNDLVIDVVERNAREVEQGLGTHVDGEQDVADLVDRLFVQYAELLTAKGTDFGCPVAASVVDVSSGSPPVRAATQSAFNTWRAALRRRAATLGPPNDLDGLIIAALEGAILLARADDDPATLERVGRSLGRLLRNTPPTDE